MTFCFVCVIPILKGEYYVDRGSYVFGIILPKIDDSIDFSEGDTYVEEKVKHITINCKAPKIWDNTETIDK